MGAWTQRQADRENRGGTELFRTAPYQELVRDMVRWVEPAAGQRWLDLGCGEGALTAALWHKSQGQVAQIVAVDDAAWAGPAIERLRQRLSPPPLPGQIEFRRIAFADGLFDFEKASFDGAVSGLALAYLEYRDPATGKFTTRAFDRIFQELRRVLKAGGQLVLSLHVPDPDFWRLARETLEDGFRSGRLARTLRGAWSLLRHGSRQKREARRGRYHFLPLTDLARRLHQAGFQRLRYRLSCAGQAYVVAASVPETAVRALAA